MNHLSYSDFNFDDSRTRKIYFNFMGVVLCIFWIISIIIYFNDYETGIAFLICNGCFTVIYLISVIMMFYSYRTSEPVLPITNNSKSMGDILNEINDVG
jgi:hypothetical protein